MAYYKIDVLYIIIKSKNIIVKVALNIYAKNVRKIIIKAIIKILLI